MHSDFKIFAGSSHPELAADICRNLGVEPGKREIIKFSNENLMVKISENVRESDVFVIQTSATPVNEHIMEMLIMIDALKHASAGRITAVLPYFPYARSDKKDQPRISITARLMADLLETAGAHRVLTMDLHSAQIQGFFRIPVDHLKAVPILTEYFRTQSVDNHVLVASDAGEAKEVGPYANRLNLPIAVIDKRRIGNEDKAVAQNLIGNVEGKDCLIVDDEIATAGTLIEAANFLLDKAGALSVTAAAVHPVLSGPAVDRINASRLKEVVVTNTIPTQGKKIKQLRVLRIGQLFAQAIERIHNGNSISVLFS